MKVDKKELNNIKFNNKLENLKAKSDLFAIDKEKQFIRNKINDLQRELINTKLTYLSLVHLKALTNSNPR